MRPAAAAEEQDAAGAATGRNGATPASAMEGMKAKLAVLPDCLQHISDELQDNLDSAQRLAVSGAAHGLNMAIVGPPGHGKSHCMGRAIAGVLEKYADVGSDATGTPVVGVGPTHTARRVMQLQIVRQGLSQTVPVHTLAAGYGVRVGEPYNADSIVRRVQGEQRAKALVTYGASTVWMDEAGQVDPANADNISVAAGRLRGRTGEAQGGQHVLLSLDVAQNLPVSASVARGDPSVRRLIFESDLFLRGDFWVVLLQTPYRNTDPRMLRVLEDLTCDNCSEELVDFFSTAAKVRFPDDPQGRLPLDERVRHFVQSNRLRDSIGKTNYLMSGPRDEMFEYQPPTMREGRSAELSRKELALIEKKHASRYTIGPLVLRKGESYFFTGGTEDEVKVGEKVLTSGEELVLISWYHDASTGRVLLALEAIEQSERVTLEPVVLKATGAAGAGGEVVEVAANVLPIIYGRA